MNNDKEKCSIDGCENEIRSVKYGLCNAHYVRFRRHGDPLGGGPLRDRTGPKPCGVEGCGEKAKSKGYCEKHYAQILRVGEILPEKIFPETCTVPNCDRPYYAMGYCEKHYNDYVREKRKRNGLCTSCGNKIATILFAGTEKRKSPLCDDCYFKLTAVRNLKTRSGYTIVKKLWEEQEGKCAYTGKILTLGVDTAIDHITSKSNGGLNLKENLCWADRTINDIKLNLNHDEFINLCEKVVSIHVR